MNHAHHNHVIDSWIAELALQARDRRREQPALELAPAQAVVTPVLVSAAEISEGDELAARPLRNFTEPRLAPRVRGDRPSRFVGGVAGVAGEAARRRPGLSAL
jgi:hypothetical protein